MRSVFCLFVAVFGFFSAISFASDHIDGPVTTQHAVTDIADLFAFPTPGRAGSISLILNAYPAVGKSSHFVERVSYTFVIRKLEKSNTAGPLFQAARNEKRVACHFATPAGHKNDTVTCQVSNGAKVTGPMNTIINGSFRVFAGQRSDPFFFDAFWAKAVANEGKIPSKSRGNTMNQLNILSLAVEVPLAVLFPDETVEMIGVAAETTTIDDPRKGLRRLDWVGRPEITNVSLVANGDKVDVRDHYNQEKPFETQKNENAYKARLLNNIAAYDRLDGKVDWSNPARMQMVETLLNDYLVIDTSKACAKGEFLKIELELMSGRSHSSCGGRHPENDIMDTLFNLYINAMKGPRQSDGVSRPYRPISNQFPHLAAPDHSLLARLKAAAARKLAK